MLLELLSTKPQALGEAVQFPPGEESLTMWHKYPEWYLLDLSTSIATAPE